MKSKFKIELTVGDWLLEVTGAVGLVLLFAFVAYSYNDLPAIIPRHFSATGHGTGFGSKTIIWSFPVIGLIIYLGLTIGTRVPQLINYPFEITPENAECQYKNVVAMARFMKTATILMLLYLSYSIFQNVYGKTDGLGILFFPIIAITFASIIGVFIYRAFKLR